MSQHYKIRRLVKKIEEIMNKDLSIVVRKAKSTKYL